MTNLSIFPTYKIQHFITVAWQGPKEHAESGHLGPIALSSSLLHIFPSSALLSPPLSTQVINPKCNSLK